MNVLVTGGAGFLGKHLVQKLLDEGCSVTVVDLEPFEDTRFEDEDVEFILGDCARLDVMEHACEDVDTVVHAAAALPIQSDDMIEHTDYYGAVRTLEAALKNNVDRFVYVSTTAVYGVTDEYEKTEDGPYNPVGPYGQAKRRAEKTVLEASDEIFVSILRPKTFVGRERLGIMEVLFDWIRRGKRIPLLGDGTNQYQLLEVNDLCQAIWLACTHPEADGVFNVGATEFGTINEDLKPVFEEADNDKGFLYLPAKPIQCVLEILELLNLSPIVRWQYATMDKDCYVDTTKIRDTLGWEPEKSNREAILENFRWYMEHYEEFEDKSGKTHRVPWDQKILKWVRAILG